METDGKTNPGFTPDQSNMLSVGDNSEVNSHTYVYDANKSLRKMTVEMLPSPDNYKDLSMIAENRPTLDELMLGKVAAKEEKEIEVDDRKGKVIKFGWIEGVLMRCLLNIWGTMLFLRLTWVVGQCGIWQGMMVITVCNLVTAISALSMSAISTNGQIAAGGVYYMISRALGPALGGSIGIMFTVANTISVGTYTVGFATSVSDLLQDAVPGWDGIVDHGCRVAGCRNNDIRIIGAPTLCLFLFIAFAGMDWVTRIQKALLVLLIAAQLDMFVGSFLDLSSGTFYVQKNSEGKVSFLDQDQRQAYGYSSWNLTVAKENLNPSWIDSSLQEDPNFMKAFGVFFTAVTGIVAGANLSGDLKDPSYSIPKGTLMAIGLTYITYMYFALQTGFVFRNQASGVAEEYRFHHSRGELFNQTYMDPADNITKEFHLPLWYACDAESNALRNTLKKTILPTLNKAYIYEKWNTEDKDVSTCTFGSGQNQMTMTYISFTGWLRYAGGFSASLSSAIASLVGAPRILQAVGKDGLYPGVGWFEKGFNANNDPWRGYILCFVGAMGCVMVASLNEIGILASNFFLAAYGLMNLSCFHSSYTRSPGWRPAFKYYNMWVSLIGAVACVVIMFLLSWVYAVITIGIQFILGAYIYIAKPEANWGSSAQALTIITALNATQELTDQTDHVKTYRPKVLVLTGNPAHRPALVDFANILTKKISVLICGHIITETGPINLANLKDGMQAWLKDHNIKGYYSVTQTPDLSGGAKSCMTLSGLGKLSPNMVMIGFKNNWKEDLVGLHHYVDIMYSAFDLRLSFAILRCNEGFDFSEQIASEQTIVSEVPAKKDEDSDGEEASAANLDVKSAATKTRKVSTAVYRGHDGNRLDNKTVESIQQFQAKSRKGYIDVWWTYDDGGLTLLIPHIIKTRKQFKDCKLRVFSLANKSDALDSETKNLASMLSRFRIDFSDVTAVPDVTKKADAATKAEFDKLIEGSGIDEAELQQEREKTNRHLRLTEMLRQYSTDAELVLMTLPLPRRGQTSPALYTAWLDIMTKNMPPTLLIRGNQQNVLTFYS